MGPGMGPDGRWKEDSPFRGIDDMEHTGLMYIEDHKKFRSSHEHECNQSLVLIQRGILGFNRALSDIRNCKKHRAGFNRIANLAKRDLELLEDNQRQWKATLRAYEDCIHDYEDLREKYLELARRLEDLGEMTDGRLNPSQGEAGGWSSPQRNVNLETRFGGNIAIHQACDIVGEEDDDDSDATAPMTPGGPSPVKSVKKSDSPCY